MRTWTAVVGTLLLGVALGASAGQAWSQAGIPSFRGAPHSLTISGERTLVITSEGVVQNADGVPLDTLPPAEQIATMCAALAVMAKSSAGIDIQRCGRP